MDVQLLCSWKLCALVICSLGSFWGWKDKCAIYRRMKWETRIPLSHENLTDLWDQKWFCCSVCAGHVFLINGCIWLGKQRPCLMCSMSVRYIIQKTLNTNKCTKGFFSSLVTHFITIKCNHSVTTAESSPWRWPSRVETCRSVLQVMKKNPLCICWCLMFFVTSLLCL
jgi:hypothetical protein